MVPQREIDTKTVGAMFGSILVVSMLVLTGHVSLASDFESLSKGLDYTSYWFIGEDATNTTVYIYAKLETEVIFSGTNDPDVDIGSILLQNQLKPEKHSIKGDALLLKFNRRELQAFLDPVEEVALEISGNLKDGFSFCGSTVIRAIEN